jgi:glutaredoxin
MVKLFSTGCPNCETIKETMKRKNISYELIDDKEEVLKFAKANNISSVPFAEIDGQILTYVPLREYVNKYNK